MNDSKLKKIVIPIGKSGWQISFDHSDQRIWEKILQLLKTSEENPIATNFILARPDGKYFHLTMVEGEALRPNGSIFTFQQPMLIEHDTGKDKVGDVVIVFRKHPKTKRWMVQSDEEKVYEDENTIKKLWRTLRSSLDNIVQSVKKTVSHSGWIYSNARRIGGKPIKTHYVIVKWSPQLAEQMMDVFDYIQSLDAMGLAAFIKSLQHMPAEPAQEIFGQTRVPPVNGNSI